MPTCGRRYERLIEFLRVDTVVETDEVCSNAKGKNLMSEDIIGYERAYGPSIPAIWAGFPGIRSKIGVLWLVDDKLENSV